MADRARAFADASERTLRRFGAAAAAIATLAVVWNLWAPAVPVYHDEDAYLLQSEIFARGRWTVPAPPLPEFFEQPHVLSAPAVAAKYPPGHPLLLSTGTLVGAPALVPLAFAALTAALLFVVTARVMNAWAAALAWLFWITAPIVLRFQPSYFSQVTTTALVLVACWAALRWRDTRRTRWMVLLALAIAWGGITRPLSMLAFAAPLGGVVLRDVWRHRTWRQLAPGIAVGLAIATIVPVWNRNTTGSWSETPLGRYRREYLPFDRLGFAADTTPPRRVLGPVMRELYDEFLAHRRRQSRENAGATALERLAVLSNQVFRGDRRWLIPAAVAGVFAVPPVIVAACAGALLLFLVHLPYAHDATWTVYYLEAVPIIALVTGAGVWAAAAIIARAARRWKAPRLAAPLRVLLAGGAGVLLLLQVPATLRYWRQRHEDTAAFARPFAAAMRTLPVTPAIVFVRFSPTRSHYVNVVGHRADLDRAPVWIVHDLGPRNAELRRLAPHRATYLLDETDMELRRQP